MNIHHFVELTSTNDHLLKLADEGAPEWTVVTADLQTSGRGRQGRSWWSPKGNLYMSILLRPDVETAELMRLPVLASLAFLDAIAEEGSSLVVKWPNDIIFKGRKLAGILMESRSEGNSISHVVIGFGVNMEGKVNSVPADLAQRLAFIDELCAEITTHELAVLVAQNMKKWSGALKGESWEEAKALWTSRAALGVPYVFRDGHATIHGIPLRLDDRGGLVIKTDTGEMTVFSGEIERV